MRVKSLIAGLVVPLFVSLPLWAAAAGALDDAVMKGDKAAVEELLRQGADPTAPQVDGTTLLHVAVQQNEVEIAEMLIRAGAAATGANRYGTTPLTLACLNGNAAMVDLLLRAGADANETSTVWGETVLMMVARTGSTGVAKTLLAAGADVNARSASGQTALMWAAAENQISVVRLLVEGGARIDARTKDGFTPLLFAVREGQSDAVRSLLDMGANVNDALPSGEIPRHIAAHKAPSYAQDVATNRLRGMLKNPYTAPGGDTALGLAIINAHYELAATLLEYGANPNAPDPRGSMLHAIAYMRRPGDTVTGRRPPPLPTGNMDTLELAKLLLDRGVNPNVRINWAEWPFDTDAGMTRLPDNIRVGRTYLSSVGATPFYLAAKHGDPGDCWRRTALTRRYRRFRT